MVICPALKAINAAHKIPLLSYFSGGGTRGKISILIPLVSWNSLSFYHKFIYNSLGNPARRISRMRTNRQPNFPPKPCSGKFVDRGYFSIPYHTIPYHTIPYNNLFKILLEYRVSDKNRLTNPPSFAKGGLIISAYYSYLRSNAMG